MVCSDMPKSSAVTALAAIHFMKISLVTVERHDFSKEKVAQA